MPAISLASVLENTALKLDDVSTHAPGPRGLLPITPEMLLTAPSGNLFGLSQNAGKMCIRDRRWHVHRCNREGRREWADSRVRQTLGGNCRMV